jgi:hypothetical protein
MFSTEIWRFWMDSRSLSASRARAMLVGVGQHLAQRAFQLAHVGAHVLGHEEGHVLGHGRALGLGLGHQDGHAHLQLGRLDGHRQAGVEAAGQALVDVHQPLGVGVAGHDDVGLLGQQRLEGVEELFLRAVLAGEELHIVDQQQVQRGTWP